MPCNSDHMRATDGECRHSKIACLLDELDGKPFNESHWRGYHPSVYSNPHATTDRAQELCERLQTVDVKDYSLEMQMWWRDHQAADKARIEREIAEAKHEAEKDAVLAKLTPYERKLLGLSNS